LATDQLNQLFELAKPLEKRNQSTSTILEDRFKETSSGSAGWQSSVTEVKLPGRQPESSKPAVFMTFLLIPSSSFDNNPQDPMPSSVQGLENYLGEVSKSPLEYSPQKPTFAGVFSAGQPAQSIPPGKPWPAEAVTSQSGNNSNKTDGNKLPGIFSAELPEQLVPPGKPWPVEEITSQVSLEDRFKETTTTISSTNKSPLEYRPQIPTFAGVFSAGQPAQLIPPGKPWPADPPATKQPTVEDRLPEVGAFVTDSTRPPGSIPFFAGSFSNGHPSQLIPPGKPWPADPPATKQPAVEDRFPEVLVTDSTRPPGSNLFFAGSFSNGYPSQLIPPGKPWPADP